MPRELRRTKELSREVHRILLEQVDGARETLAGKSLSNKSIHQARKTLKKARATLRLLRESMPASSYQRENRALRDIARPLSAARDAAVMLETLDKLEKLYGAAARTSIPPALREALEGEESRTGREIRGPKAKQPPPAKQLSTVEQRLARAAISGNGWDEVGRSLRRIYRNGRRAMKAAKRTPSAECLHEWRKQTKHLWYQTQVLQPLAPATIEELGDQAHRLSDYLGDDHDLAVLREKVTTLRDTFQHDGNSGALLALIDRCRTQLQDKAFLLGGRIYDAAPRDFADRFERYWKRWCKHESPSLSRTPT